MSKQTHLSRKDTINLGSFYTPDFLISRVYEIIKRNLDIADLKSFALLDTSCGDGNFFRFPQEFEFAKVIGVDIDPFALKIAKERFPHLKFLQSNSLANVCREKFYVEDNEALIIVGNPPYNDRTSIVQSRFKEQVEVSIDSDLLHRDLGVSFMLSFEKLKADFVCILHPLSYLIKKSNFAILKKFTSKYFLVDSLIVSSAFFCPNSLNYFPILIGLYRRDECGMDFSFIEKYMFKTIEGREFKLNSFDFIGNYIDKYPNRNRVLDSQKVAMFYTMRDINALKRSRTFVDQQNANTINIAREKYSLYCYVDVFKKIIDKIPYYLRNCDILIDYERFKELEKDFVFSSENHIMQDNVLCYFKTLLGEHYGCGSVLSNESVHKEIE